MYHTFTSPEYRISLNNLKCNRFENVYYFECRKNVSLRNTLKFKNTVVLWAEPNFSENDPYSYSVSLSLYCRNDDNNNNNFAGQSGPTK